MSYGWITTEDGRQIYRKLARAPRGERSDLPAPMLRTDGMDAVICPLDGKPYESKSEYYATVKAHGCEIVGNDSHWDRPAPKHEPKGVKQDIKEAWDRLSS